MNISYRKLSESDLAYRLKWLNDPEVNRYLGHRVRAGTDEAFHRQWFEKYQADDSRQIFTIEVDSQPVGQVGLLDINLEDQNASLYIIIGQKDYWGQGIGQAALEYIADWGFKTLGLHKIWLEVHALNEAAIKLYQKCGYETEGIFVDQVRYDDRFGDEIRMAVVAR